MDKAYPLQVTIPAGTPKSSPASFPWPHDAGTLTDLDIDVPDGHAGLTGIQILVAGVVIAPWGGLDYLIANGRIITFPYNEYINPNQLSVRAYNTDIYDHSFRMLAKVKAATAEQIATAPVDTTPIQIDTSLLSTDALSADALLTSDELNAALANSAEPPPSDSLIDITQIGP